MASPVLNDNTVYLIDGSGYIFRAYYAIKHLKSKKGVPTNAVYGFTTMLLKLLKNHDPKYLAIAFDRKEPTFRHEIYQAYKGNRPSPPEDLLPQFELIHRVVKALNIKMLSKPGFEADDLIGTLAKRARLKDRQVIIVTGDKDFMQLVDGQVFLLDELRALKIGSEQFIDKDQVQKDMGVPPERVVDLLALAGDSSDNVPGVVGIGKKTAAELINEFGPVEQVIEMAPLIKQKGRREKILDGQKNALLSKRLVTIDEDVDFDCSIEDLSYDGADVEQTKKIFLELDFNRLLSDKAIFKQEAKPILRETNEGIADRAKYVLVTEQRQLSDLVSRLHEVKKIAIKTESEGLDSTSAKLIGIAMAFADNQAAYIPIAHSCESKQLAIEEVRKAFAKIVAHENKVIVAQDAKYAHKILSRHGFSSWKIGGDPMLQSYLLHQEREQHDLDSLSQKYLDHRSIKFEDICGDKKHRISFREVPLKTAADYSAQGADLTLRLEHKLLTEIKEQGLEKLYYELELSLEEVLSRMELTGVKLDTTVLKTASLELKNRLVELEGMAVEMAGEAFNLSSPKQVGQILFEQLALPKLKKTKTGYSTDSSVLEKLVGLHPLPKILLEHRVVAKLINTYIDTLPLLINAETGRIHTSYNQFVTATGRLSSSDPNLQNIPIKTPEGRRIRQAFVAKPGYRLISLDYSQVELRILAYVSRDPVLLDSFAKDEDVHQRTACEIFDVDKASVTKQQRNAAKTINFGILYGMGVHRLAQTLNIPRKDAQIYLDKYYEKYAGVFAWKNEALSKARASQEVRTLFGRKRALAELSSRSSMEQARGERIAINTPIQGTAADIIKRAMIDTDQFLREKGHDATLIMQVHDELVIEAKEDDAADIAAQISQIMSRGHGLDLDLKVEFGIAKNWDDAH